MTAVLSKKLYSSDLSFLQWKILEPYIPPAKHGGRHREHPMIKIINAIIYRVKR